MFLAEENLSPLSAVEHQPKAMAYIKVKEQPKLAWFLAPILLLFWLAIFSFITIPVFHQLPKGLTVADVAERAMADQQDFVAERAQRILYDFDKIGLKPTGSYACENLTVQLLLDEIEQIAELLNAELFELELDVQVVSGNFVVHSAVKLYERVQNIVVKLSPKTASSDAALLLNSHFDSKPGSPGTGDDGAMVVVMLEVLRVMATAQQPIEHSIIFLFNGAEECGLRASHGFITQHKWAKNCKAVINLESAGSGNKEVLFQSGPNHPWLVRYYKSHAKHPYANSLAEETFQSGLIPSDTDFRIFRDFGHIPGLDMAHAYNGYVYHTVFDNYDVIPLGTLQNTGDNVLAITRALANASELHDTSLHTDGNVVFYDFMGLYLICYTQLAAFFINIFVTVLTSTLIFLSMQRIAQQSHIKFRKLLRMFVRIFLLHLVGVLLAFVFPGLLSELADRTNFQLVWFTHKWLVLGLYVLPACLGLVLPTLMYLKCTRDDKILPAYKVQLVLHAHCLILCFICLLLTLAGVRSAYLPMVAVLFYGISLLLNCLTTLQDRAYSWIICLILSQIMPFLFFSYVLNGFTQTLMPMMGRTGTNTNPELLISAICALGAVLALGFSVLILSVFRKARTLLLCFILPTLLCFLLALTPLGFPYTAKTNVQRLHLTEMRFLVHDYNGSIIKDETGLLFEFQDKRKQEPFAAYVNVSNLQSLEKECKVYKLCGVYLSNQIGRGIPQWLPLKVTRAMPGLTSLKLLQRTANITTSHVHLEFEITGPSLISIVVVPLEGVEVSKASFSPNMLQLRPPYYVSLVQGKENKPYKFSIDLLKTDQNLDVPLVELSITSSFSDPQYEQTPELRAFIKQLPDFVFPLAWPSQNERWTF